MKLTLKVGQTLFTSIVETIWAIGVNIVAGALPA